ncbi:MAG: leucine-rich repeat protein, partial [Oscillospiraceae bacterium]|nr:leucine-rich repeat protein [Oscillospiraceae bacterium]
MQKRILALVLALSLCLGCLPAYARAVTEDGGTLTDTLSWAVYDTTLTISGTGPMPDYDDYEDTPWADYHWDITHVVITEGVERLGSYAFGRFWELEAVELPHSLTSIGDHAFYDCDELTEITIPAYVEQIHSGAFYYSGIQQFHVAEGNSTYCDIDGVLYSTDGSWLMLFPPAYPGGRYTIPDHVTGIGDYAFWNNDDLTYLCIPSSVTEVGAAPFLDATFESAGPMGSGCALEYGWENAIPEWVLSGMSVSEFYIPGSITSIGTCAMPYVGTLYYGLSMEDWLTLEGSDEVEAGEYVFNYIPGTPEETYPIETTVPTEPEETEPPETTPEEEELSFPQMPADQVLELEIPEPNMVHWFQYTPEHTERYVLGTYLFDNSHDVILCIFEKDGTVVASGIDTEVRLEATLEAGKTYVISVSYVYGDTETIPVLLRTCHDYRSEVITPATCSAGGRSLETCADCGCSREVDTKPAHSFSDGICVHCGSDCVAQGDFGQGLHWRLSPDGVLTVSGEGTIPEYLRFASEQFFWWPDPEKESAPWAAYADEIHSLVVEDGITCISEFAFWGCANLSEVTMPDSLVMLYPSCFWECPSLRELVVPERVNMLRGTFRGLEKLTFLGPVPTDAGDAFRECEEGMILLYRGSQDDWAGALANMELPRNCWSYDLETIMDPADFSFDKTDFRLSLGGVALLESSADPYSRSMVICWTAEDPTIVELTGAGYARGLKTGSTAVYARTADGTLLGSCTVTVTEADTTDSSLVELALSMPDLSESHNYRVWDAPGAAALYPNADGSWDMVWLSEEEGIVIARFDGGFNLLWTKTVGADDVIPAGQTIPMDTLLYGGSYAGEVFNYLLLGMANPNYDDKQEVLRLCRYDKDWNKVDDCVIRGANTYIPFDKGSVDFAEAGGRLYIHTSHKMYPDEKGTCHQANMTFAIDLASMTVADQWYEVMNLSYGYVSHSFAQRIRVTEDHVFRVDHGDAYPRAIVMTRAPVDGPLTDAESLILFPISGNAGSNETGVSLGGFELTETGCIIAGNSLRQNGQSWNNGGQRNIFVTMANQDLSSAWTVWLTDYPDSDYPDHVSTPHLVPVSPGIFLVMWEEGEGWLNHNPRTCVVLVSDTGEVLSEIRRLECRMSSCPPVAADDGLVSWYSADEAVTSLYRLSWQQLISDPQRVDAVFGHRFEMTVVAPTCECRGYNHYTCTFCGAEYDDTYTDPLGHVMGAWEVLWKPTCYEDGSAERSCQRGCGYTEQGSIPQRHHDYVPIVTPPTCAMEGYTTYTCSYCLEQYEDDYTEALGHDHSHWYVSREPGCTYSGEERSDCTRCGYSITRTLEPVGHNYVEVIYEPTCTTPGYSRFVCYGCQQSYPGEYSAPSLGHDHSQWYVIHEPDCTHSGLEESACNRCGVTAQRFTDPKHSYVNGTCTLCGKKDPDYQEPVNPFVDVTADAYFFEPVLWAVDNGITSGTSATTFAPNATCTRAQVVTFLWRAMGQPEPASNENPFSDVAPGDYFYKAVLWAVENGITSGTGGGKFSPNSPCTRSQVVTFLWRTMGQPAPQRTDNPFTDVASGIYYYQPVLWAVENGITSGTSATTFAPDNPCTRAQVVTFL